MKSGGAAPHRLVGSPRGSLRVVSSPSSPDRLITLDGSSGEGGGQILRSALTLSLLTGRPFRIVKIRANREQPGLRPQHLNAVMAAAKVGQAEVVGASVGSRDLTFRPKELVLDDLSIDIGTAGSTALVLHTLYLPLALRAGKPVRLTLVGGTFNFRAPVVPVPRPHLEGPPLGDGPGHGPGHAPRPASTRAAAASSTPGSSPEPRAPWSRRIGEP